LTTDRSFFKDAKEAGVFKKLNGEAVTRIFNETGSTKYALVTCGDCRHSVDIVNHLVHTFGSREPHLIGMNGGGPLLDGLCKANNRPGGRNRAPDMRYQVWETLTEIPDIHQVFLVGHWECLVVNVRGGMSQRDQAISLIEGKAWIKERFPARKVGLLYHLYEPQQTPEEQRRMYHFCATDMRAFLDRTRTETMTA
jgi:hypothetical protein